MKTPTIDLKGKAYAQVKDRIVKFRTDNPRGLIETLPTIQADGSILFKARILTDKADSSSAESSGHALGKVGDTKEKAFEKLETIAVGRALALLGYASDGEIASSEEMEEFEEYKKTQFEETVMEMVSKINDVQTLEELQSIWAPLPGEMKKALLTVKNEKKNNLMNPNENN